MTGSRRDLIEKILYHVEKPGRYVGGEHNQIVKDWGSVDTKWCLIFPDIYDIGQTNLGLAMLYQILNAEKNILAERSFAPWVDMEEELRKHRIPLFSLESKKPLSGFDILGFTLPYESIYTNVLNILDLAEIPMFTKERSAEDPLVIAGGQACFNPEPVSDFFDAFVIGEGEEVILDISRVYGSWRQAKLPRLDLHLALAKLEGVYVPSFYSVSYHPEGLISEIKTNQPGVPLKITKRIVPVLPPHPTKFLVPNVEIVHDRMSVEIMRGCTRGCRFCHAGMVNRPVRQRDASVIIPTIQEAVNATGYEEVGLLSLSSSDHTEILDLTRQVYDCFHEQKLAFSLPSLRIESFSLDLMDELKELKPGGGFTLAPEAATERMRAVINKPLDDHDFYQTVTKIFEKGWRSLKLYYMIGLPTETMEDVDAILQAGIKVQQIGRKLIGKSVKIHLGIASLIPKPHTPFQWMPVHNPDSIQEKLDYLKAGTRKAGIKMSYNIPDSTLLESWLSRGDRRLNQVVFNAWQRGAKFDAWGERDNLHIWRNAFAEAEIDPDFYAYRERDLEETLPWDHINIGVSKNFLKRDYQWSQQGRTRADCRESCFMCGILDAFGEDRPADGFGYWGCP
ncbi:MAG: TIGR03960 family B12-binding radical SAM protein [Chloroflexi bacterium]|nr:TIGR03960 family B12-binding radical SAM protein [Chloroflexota bacterium]